jgi:uncharacterized protein (TIGR02145 family)
MKNFFFLTAAVILTALFTGCSSKKDIPVPAHVELFGTPHFATATTWTAGTQTWSDAVVVKIKSDFDGNKVDYRDNPGYKGTLFSWAAVYQYKDYLCPAPWRVPTKDDFIALDIALGGTGVPRGGGAATAATIAKYISDWGLQYNGWCDFAGIYLTGSKAFYWTLTDNASYRNEAYILCVSTNEIDPSSSQFKDRGVTLRCVK